MFAHSTQNWWWTAHPAAHWLRVRKTSRRPPEGRPSAFPGSFLTDIDTDIESW